MTYRRLVEVKNFDDSLGVNRAYNFDASANRLKKDKTDYSTVGLNCGVESPMDPAVHQGLYYNDYSQLTNTDYAYDVFGRATTVPSLHTANQAGNVTFAYSPEDRILSQTQGSTKTDYTYDALGRRYQDKVGSSVKTVRHYTDETDNPSWVTGTGTAAAQTDIFTTALASSLNATRKVNGTTTTTYLNIGNLHGDTITSLQLPSSGYVAGPNELNVFDEYGVQQILNPEDRPDGVSSQTNPSTLFILNYGSLGQPQRETTDTGIQFMGARGYNPITGQFLSPDPIQGGNETPYNYPNDPINKTDLTGEMEAWQSALIGIGISIIAGAIVAAICASTAGVGCLITGLVANGIAGMASGGIEADRLGYKGSKRDLYVFESGMIGSISSGFGYSLARGIGLQMLKKPEALRRFAKLPKFFRKVGQIAAKSFPSIGIENILDDTRNKSRRWR
jgi:RHS repeat-associated protein